MYADEGIVHVVEPVGEDIDDDHFDGFQLKGTQAKQRFTAFFRNFHIGNNYLYRDALVKHWNREEYFVEVDLAHVSEYDEILFNNIQSSPAEFLPFFESGAKEALKYILTSKSADKVSKEKIPDFQVILRTSQYPRSLRSLTSEHVNKLVKVPGIVISCSRVRAKATMICAQCSICNNRLFLLCKSTLAGVSIPQKCPVVNEREQCKGEYAIMPDKCEYLDQQILKLQECPEVVPTGEMPRHIQMITDRYLVDRVTPGTRMSVIATLSLMMNETSRSQFSNATVRTPYLKILGMQSDADTDGRMSSLFTAQEEEQMLSLARDPDIYMKLTRSIAPQISGDYTTDIKKALACLLMGGSRKKLDDGVKLRGDINVLLMGDPSTAKSQFLKFIEKVAPIGVYTSGKGSSAAGLTAMVTKDKSGEFYLEGGAMVLADGGIICIDEFDKMRETDRVAIHEAMEQQTISIAKAGITTMLNSRTSVLAAANPIGGRYDDLKSVGDNIDLMTTILSRFDCIFIVKDVRDEERDKAIARHVLGVHIDSYNADAHSTEIDVATLKKFVLYCRERCAPRLNNEAAALLSSHYVQIRNQVRNSLSATGESIVVPISIRQLEALVRLSESIAKMRLSAEATVNDVAEALRLFRVSTLAASQANPMLANMGPPTDEVRRAEDFLKRRLSVRMTVASKSLVEEGLLSGLSNDALKRAIAVMVQRNELQELNQQKILKRLR